MEEGRSLSTSMHKSIRSPVARKSEHTVCLSAVITWHRGAHGFMSYLALGPASNSFPDSQTAPTFTHRLLEVSEATLQNLFVRI